MSSCQDELFPERKPNNKTKLAKEKSEPMKHTDYCQSPIGGRCTCPVENTPANKQETAGFGIGSDRDVSNRNTNEAMNNRFKVPIPRDESAAGKYDRELDAKREEHITQIVNAVKTRQDHPEEWSWRVCPCVPCAEMRAKAGLATAISLTPIQAKVINAIIREVKRSGAEGGAWLPCIKRVLYSNNEEYRQQLLEHAGDVISELIYQEGELKRAKEGAK